MLEQIDIDILQHTLPQISNGVDKYLAITSTLHTCDVSLDSVFQRTYNGFYRMRQRKPVFYQVYYDYMERYKQEILTFEDVMNYLHSAINRIEPSFSSKLLATINPDMPVWDANVLSQLAIVPPRFSHKDRLAETIKTYARIVDWYAYYMETPNAKDVIHIFDQIYPNKPFTSVKKIDFALWSMGEKIQ